MKHLSKIEGYLKNTLSNEERNLFDEECKTNKELIQELNFYLKAHQPFNQRKRTELNRHYSIIKANNSIPSKTNSNKKKIILNT